MVATNRVSMDLCHASPERELWLVTLLNLMTDHQKVLSMEEMMTLEKVLMMVRLLD